MENASVEESASRNGITTELPPMPEKEFSGTLGQGGRYSLRYRKAMAKYIVENNLFLTDAEAKCGIPRGTLGCWVRYYGPKRVRQNSVVRKNSFPGKQKYTEEFKAKCLEFIKNNPHMSLVKCGEILGVPDTNLSRWRTDSGEAPKMIRANSRFAATPVREINGEIPVKEFVAAVPKITSTPPTFDVALLRSLLNTALKMIEAF